MLRLLVKTDTLIVDGASIPVWYFEVRTGRGTRRYSAEIVLGAHDRIIIDDDSVTNLEARTARLVPATVYSRMLSNTELTAGLTRRARHAGPYAASDTSAAAPDRPWPLRVLGD